MPLSAYFWKVGAMLLALLFVADALLPRPPLAEKAAVHRPAIRVSSEQKWPERVDFNTRVTVVVVPAPVTTTAEISSAPDRPAPFAIKAAPPAIANALALLPRLPSPPLETADRPRARRTQRAVVRPQRRPTPQMVVVARQGQLAWFRYRYW